MNIIIIMSPLHLTLVAGTATSVGTNAFINTSPAMGHVMKEDTNAGASVFTGPVSVEQSHSPGTVSSTAACHQRIAAPTVGLVFGVETPMIQCAPLDRLSAKQSSVMEPVLTMTTQHL